MKKNEKGQYTEESLKTFVVAINIVNNMIANTEEATSLGSAIQTTVSMFKKIKGIDIKEGTLSAKRACALGLHGDEQITFYFAAYSHLTIDDIKKKD